MNRKFKTLLSLGLCILMIITCVPSSFAVEPSVASSGPIITASVSESKYEIAANFFCIQPTIKIVAEAGLKKVTVEEQTYDYTLHKYVETELTDYTTEDFEIETEYSFIINDKKSGTFIVTVDDENGATAKVTFKIGHIMGSRSSTFLPPTCEKAGYSSYTQTCRYCKEQYYKVETPIETAKPLGHLYKMEGDSEVPSNTADDPCEVDSSADGTLNQYICQRCGQIKNVITDGAEYEESKHTWGTYTGELNQTASGCNTPGLEFEECTKCHALRLKTYTAPPQQHDNVQRNPVTPTCTRPSSVDLYCSKCDTFITTRITGGNTAHKYVPDQEYTLTCTQGYEGPATCSVCENHIDNYKISPLPHTFETVRVEPTCSAAGSSKQVCTVCKTVKEGSEKEIPKLKHIPEPDDYDCYTPVKCTICGEIVVPAKEHDLVVNWTSVPDMPYHTKRCKNEGCRYEATENHYTARPDLACEYQTKCAACNVAMQPTGHTSTVTPVPVNVLNMSIYQVEPDPNGLYHAIICTTCNKVLDRRSLTVHSAVNKQDITDCTKALTCVCGKVYREAKPEHVFPDIPVKGSASSEYHEYDCVDPVCTQRKTAPHDYSYKVEIIPGKAATCTEEGYHHEVRECVCGAKTDSVVTDPATGHDFGDLVQVAPTTCTANGSSYRRCKTCGYDEYETYDATGHVWEEEYTVDAEATCHSEGTESIHCSVCHIANPDMQRSIPKKDHTFTIEVTVSEPTCTDAGIKEYECSVCHERGNPEAIPAKGHEFEEWTCDEDSTCTTAGTQQRKCKNCSLIETQTCPDHPAKGHTWGEYVENNDATIDKNATKTRTCTVCGETETEEIPDSKLHQHFWGPYEYQNDATCFADGTEVAECQNCGTKSEPRTAVGTKLEHSFGVYEPDGNATCLEDGTETAVCVYCGIEKDTRTDEGSALGHSYGEYRYMEDATCLYDGHEASECLNGCGYVDIRIAAGTQLPHSFINYVYNDDATCEADGTETAICELCKTEKDTRTAEGTGGHIWSNPKFEWSDDYASANVVYTCEREGGHSKPIPAAVETVTVEATCETDGSKTAEAKAEVDGVMFVDSVVVETYPATGHKYEDKSDSDFHWKECSVCGNIIDKTAHTPGEYVTDGDHHWKECTECGEIIGKTKHTPGDEYITDGESHWKECTVCGEILGKTEHTPDDVYVSDGDYHWHECIECGKVLDKTAHTPGKDYVFDGDFHWHKCTECGEDLEKSEHELSDGTCTVCGKVVHAHTPSKDYITDGNYHWHECTECGEILDRTEHTPGTEFFTDEVHHWHKCTVCGEEVGKTVHTSGAEYVTDEDYHWHECTDCGEIVGKTEHRPDDEYITDDDYHWQECLDCDEILNKTKHIHGDEYITDDDYHWYECSDCGKILDKTEHNLGKYITDDDYHWYECSDCGMIIGKTAHTPGKDYVFDGDFHWHECTECGMELDKSEHKLDDGTCTVCGKVVHAHTPSKDYVTDGNYHWHECTECGEILDRTEHTPGAEYITDGDYHWKKCTVCGEILNKAEHNAVNGACTVCGKVLHEHTPGEKYVFDGDTHWKVCTVCGEIMNRSSHSFTRRGYCTVCGFTVDLPKPTTNPTVIPETKSLVIDEVEVSEDIHSEVADVCGKILGVYYIGLGNTDYKPGDRVTVRVYAPGAKKDSLVLIRDEWEILKDAAMRIDGDYVEFTVDAGLIDKWHYFAIVDGFVSPTDVEVPQQAKYNAEVREIAG